MKSLGSLLLIVGTALAGIGAANTEKASRSLPLTDQSKLTGEFLFDHLRADDSSSVKANTALTAQHIQAMLAAGIETVQVVRGSQESAGGALGRVLTKTVQVPGKIIVARGTELTAEAVAKLRDAKLDTVTVKVPPRDKETVSLDKAAGRVLAKPVEIGKKKREFKAGDTLTLKRFAQLRGRAATVTVHDRDGKTMSLAEAMRKVPPPEKETIQLSNGAIVARTPPLKLPPLELAADLEHEDADLLPAGRFIDQPALDGLTKAGVTSVEVKISGKFAFAGWALSWMFVMGIAVMGIGVFVSRSSTRGAATDGSAESEVMTAAAIRSHLEAMTRAVEALAAQADSMECEQIHTQLDPLFVRYGQPFIDHREVLRSAFGGVGFAHIMGPFASAERRLNRAWSAAVDGYVDEAREQVAAAGPYLHETLDAFPET